MRQLPLFVCALSLVLSACSDGGTGSDAGSDADTGAVRLVVTADWLNQSLTLFDYDLLTDGVTGANFATVDTVDLSTYEPGPLEVEITPDGTTALVSVSPGFFGSGVTNGLVGMPTVADDGRLLVVDLETRTVAAELFTAHVPMGIAISADGTRAYTANYGTDSTAGNTMSIIDIPGLAVIEDITVGRRPEQVALSPDGSLGIINLASDDGVVVFQTADPSGTLSLTVPTGNDPSGVAFVSDTRAIVANSLSSDFTLVGTDDPNAPTVVRTAPAGVNFPYGVNYVQASGLVYAAAGVGGPTSFVTVDVSNDLITVSPTTELQGGAFPLTMAVDSTASFAFVPHMIDNMLSVVDLGSGAQRGLSWLTEAGPSYVAIQPAP